MRMTPQLVTAAARAPRRVRRPVHMFQTRVTPYALTPCMLAPVLPGETLKKAMIQMRGVSDAVKNDRLGWHSEMYFFYVRLTDLPNADDYRNMVVDPGFDAVTAGLTSDTSVAKHFFRSDATLPGIDWVAQCLDVVAQHYFRNEDQTPGDFMVDGYPAVRVIRDSWMQSLRPAADAATLDVDVDLDADGTVMASEVERARLMWQTMVTSGLTDMSYADYLKSYGIRGKEVAEIAQVPELIRNIRDWSYPARIVDPATGAVNAALVASLQETIDKDRFFKEPGFIFAAQVFRPKVYLNAPGSLSSWLQTGLDWLPAEVLNSVAYGLKEFAATRGPLPQSSVPYVVDLRDLLQYGESFANFALTAGSDGVVAVPTADIQRRDYLSDSDVAGLFADGNDHFVHCDGVVSLNIASALSADVTGAS